MTNLNNRIREVRIDKKISGTKIAKELSISPQYFYDIEKGERNLSADLAVKIATALDVSLSYLLMESESDISIQDPGRVYRANHELEDIITKETDLNSKIIDALKLMTDDEGYFFEDIKEDTFKAVATNLHMSTAYHNSNDHNLYMELTNEQLDDPEYAHEKDTIIQEIDEAYNYKTVKLVLPNNDFDNKLVFLEKIQEIIINNDLEQKETPEKEFHNKLELSDNDLLDQFELELDGQKLSEDEAKGVIAYLRSLRQIDK